MASGQQIALNNKPELIVGRAHKGQSLDIDLAPHGGSQAGVSRRHSRLLRKEDQWFVEDLGSTNGTFVNGVRLSPNQLVALKQGDKLRFGQIEVQFDLEEA
jgi:pSer/pThr/pTyr-binding forkhead associated (FHA) protein